MPASVKDKQFVFSCASLPPDTFSVVSFTGHEAISSPYRFEITLVSAEMNLDLSSAVGGDSTLSIATDGDTPVVFNGLLTSIEQLQSVDGYTVYKAVLVPRLSLLAHIRHNQVFLGKAIPQILEMILKADRFTSLDYEFRVGNNYKPFEYICQYAQSDLDFLSQRMERDGIYYFFEQGAEREKLIVTDNMGFHKKFISTPLNYSPPSGLDDSVRESGIYSFSCRQTLLPAVVNLKDYNYRQPSQELLAQAPVSPNGMGEIFLYGDHFFTQEDGNALAKIRSEEFLCRERIFSGESLSPFLRTGYLFDLAGHYRNDFNTGYLVIEIEHSGSQTGLLTAGIRNALSLREGKPYYRSIFTAIPASIQFRPERKTHKSRFSGTMNAVVDAESSGQYAELDEQGRYKVRLPFDLSGVPGGKASSWIRKAEPYAGDGLGMHFPLHKGAEVILTFIDGDPDRPIISAAVPNPLTQSMVTDRNQTMAVIQTGGRNKIAIEDLQGSERILLQSPHANTWLRMGAPNDPDPGEEESGFRIHTEDQYVANIGSNYTQQILGNKIDVLVGASEEFTAGAKSDVVLGTEMGVMVGLRSEIGLCGSVNIQGGITWEYNSSRTYNLSPISDLIGSQQVSIRAGGTLPHFWKIGAAAVSAAVALSAAASASGHASEVGHIVGGIVAGLSAVFGTYLTATHASLDTTSYASQIELNLQQIEMKCPVLDVKVLNKTELTSPNVEITSSNKLEIKVDDTKAQTDYTNACAPIIAANTNADQQYAQDLADWQNRKKLAALGMANLAQGMQTWLAQNPAPQQPAPAALPNPPALAELELVTAGKAAININSITDLELKGGKSVAINVPNVAPTTKVEFKPADIELQTTNSIELKGAAEIQLKDSGNNLLELSAQHGVKLQDSTGGYVKIHGGNVTILSTGGKTKID